MKTLEIGRNYGEIFGLDATKGNKIIYLGGTLFMAHKGEKTMEVDSAPTVEKIKEYINRPSVSMGAPK